MRTLGRLATLGSAAVLVLTACSSDDDPPETSGEESPSAGPTGDASAEPEDVIADLKSRLAGTSLTVGSSASSNPAITGAVRTVQYLNEEFGMDIELRQLDSDPLVAAVISGSVDVGQLSLAGAAAGRARGAEFLAFAGDDQPNPYYVVGTRDITSLEQLEGQPFGATSNLQQITGQTATACLESVGISITEDVELLQLANTGAVADALRTGQVAAGLTAPHRMAPLIAEEGEGSYNILCLGADVSPQLNNVWMSQESWVDENPDIALAFAIASIETGRWSHAEKEEWIELALEAAPEYERPAVESIYGTYVEEMDMWPENGSLDVELCEATLQASLDSGALEEAMECDEIIDFSYQEQALELLGTV